MANHSEPLPNTSHSSGQSSIGVYQPVADLEVAKEYLVFLQKLEDAQNSRLQTIEGKIAQLIAQSSIIVSISALFVPLLSDKFSTLPIVLVVIIILAFGTILTVYLLSIYKSCETLLIHKFRFSRQSVHSVIKQNRPTNVADFVNQQNEDLVYLLQVNESIINEKGTSLIKAAESFRRGNIMLGVFTILVSVFLVWGTGTDKETKGSPNVYLNGSINNSLQLQPIYNISKGQYLNGPDTNRIK